VGVNKLHQGTPDGRSVALAYVTGQDALVNVTGGNVVQGTCKTEPLSHVQVATDASNPKLAAVARYLALVALAEDGPVVTITRTTKGALGGLWVGGVHVLVGDSTLRNFK